MIKVTRIVWFALLTLALTVSSAYAQNTMAIIWEAPAQWMEKDSNVKALEAKIREVMPVSEYTLQPLETTNSKVAAYRLSRNLSGNSKTDAPPKLTTDAVLNLAAGNDYAMLLRMDAIVSDYFPCYDYLPHTDIANYVFNIVDIKVYNTKTRKLLYKKQFMSKAANNGANAFFAVKYIDRISQERKDEIFQKAFENCLENFSFDASHIHRLEN